jgi:hypothetical protein
MLERLAVSDPYGYFLGGIKLLATLICAAG